MRTCSFRSAALWAALRSSSSCFASCMMTCVLLPPMQIHSSRAAPRSMPLRNIAAMHNIAAVHTEHVQRAPWWPTL